MSAQFDMTADFLSMEPSASSRAQCDICPHACKLSEGQVGLCRARVAQDGRTIPQNYGRITSLALDPIEKKPLMRFHPGAMILSVGSYGCNLSCPFCQNASIAQTGAQGAPWQTMTPNELVDRADRMRKRGNIGIAYTYNEPLVGYEFVRDTAKLAHERALINVLVSNGFINEEPLGELLGLIDAANIDLKGFDARFYQLVGGGGHLDTVCNTISTLVRSSTCHVEVTTLIVPGENDDERVIEEAARWLSSLSPDIPYHVTRFFPQYRMTDRHATPVETVYRLAEVARRHLNYVYVGNC